MYMCLCLVGRCADNTCFPVAPMTADSHSVMVEGFGWMGLVVMGEPTGVG